MAARWFSLTLCAGLASASCPDGTCPKEPAVAMELLQRTMHFTQPRSYTMLQTCRLRPNQQRRLSFSALHSVASATYRGPAGKQEAAECIRLGSRIRRDSREEAEPLFRRIDALQASALEAPVQKNAAKTCINAAVSEVTFNRPLTLIMNRTTHTMEHIVQLLRHYPDDADLNEALLSYIAGAASSCCPELTPFVQRVGGFDLLFSALDRFEDNPKVMMSAWRGLSDHSHNTVGAEIIANHGGEMQGIRWLVDQMRSHPEPGLAEDPYDHLSLKYEIMQNINGMLEHDSNNKYGAAFVKEGFPEQLLYSMRVEPELRATQDVACQCMSKLLTGDPSAAKVFADGGAIKLTVDAVKRYQDLRDNTPWCGSTLGLSYMVVPACASSLMLLARANRANADEMIQLGLLDALKDKQRPLFTVVTAPLRVMLASRAWKKTG